MKKTKQLPSGYGPFITSMIIIITILLYLSTLYMAGIFHKKEQHNITSEDTVAKDGLIKLALEKGQNLREICHYQELDEEMIRELIVNGICMHQLYMHKELSKELIMFAIEEGYHLDILYRFQELDNELIKIAIKKGEYLSVLYEYQNFKRK